MRLLEALPADRFLVAIAMALLVVVVTDRVVERGLR